MHAPPYGGCALAEALGTDTVLVLPAPGVLCADGLLAADLRAAFSRSVTGGGVDAIYATLETEADAWLAAEAVAPAASRTVRMPSMCYEGQGGELPVPWAGTLDATAHAFVGAHQALYGFRLDAPVRLVTVRVDAIGLLPPPVRPVLPPGAKPYGEAVVHWPGGTQATPLYDRASLGAGDGFGGPAILTQLDTTTLVPPGWVATVHRSGTVVLSRA